jgi:hypothetical protein
VCNTIETEPNRSQNRQKIKFIIVGIIIATVSKLVNGIHLMCELYNCTMDTTLAMHFLKLNAHSNAVSLARKILVEQSGMFLQAE